MDRPTASPRRPDHAMDFDRWLKSFGCATGTKAYPQRRKRGPGDKCPGRISVRCQRAVRPVDSVPQWTRSPRKGRAGRPENRNLRLPFRERRHVRHRGRWPKGAVRRRPGRARETPSTRAPRPAPCRRRRGCARLPPSREAIASMEERRDRPGSAPGHEGMVHRRIGRRRPSRGLRTSKPCRRHRPVRSGACRSEKPRRRLPVPAGIGKAGAPGRFARRPAPGG